MQVDSLLDEIGLKVLFLVREVFGDAERHVKNAAVRFYAEHVDLIHGTRQHDGEPFD